MRGGAALADRGASRAVHGLGGVRGRARGPQGIYQGRRAAEEATIGTVAAGKAADLVVIAGNPADKIDEVENVETVFKDGLGYDPRKLIESVQGLVGLR